MLWRAGQERVTQEAREQMAAQYVAVRDGYVAGRVASGAATWKGAEHIPPYARTATVEPLRSPATRDLALAQLGVMFPGIVRMGIIQ